MKQDLSKDVCLFGWTSAASPNLRQEVASPGAEQKYRRSEPLKAIPGQKLVTLDLAQGKLQAGHSVFTFPGLGSSGFSGS